MPPSLGPVEQQVMLSYRNAFALQCHAIKKPKGTLLRLVLPTPLAAPVLAREPMEMSILSALLPTPITMEASPEFYFLALEHFYILLEARFLHHHL